jgi:hypothetical protein
VRAPGVRQRLHRLLAADAQAVREVVERQWIVGLMLEDRPVRLDRLVVLLRLFLDRRKQMMRPHQRGIGGQRPHQRLAGACLVVAGEP